MSNRQTKPDVDRILGGLKDFQRQTVDHVFRRLYLDDDPAKRFLIADEVGLGKTLVARGVVAKAIEHLWDKRARLDVVYICANSDIARQNVNRLNITGQREMAIATRITLLPQYLHNLQGNKINFVSFTPGTSFDLRSSGGIWPERAMIYHILREGWGFGGIAGPKNLLQVGMNKDNWRQILADYDETVDPTLKAYYLRELERNAEIRQRFDELCEMFNYSRDYTSDECRQRDALIGDLRRILAETCVNALEPDIVILDEFQRFKGLLDGEDEIARLAHAVFNHQDAKVLLLSATPYKMYTMYHEQEADEDHYADFVRTVGFLFDNPAKTAAFEEDLRSYRRALLRSGPDGEVGLLEAKGIIEQKLRSVMVRTERIAVTAQQDSMILDLTVPCVLAPADLKSFATLDAVARHLEVGDVVEYWKSAPYLLNLMEHTGYKIKVEFLDQVQSGDHAPLAALVAAAQDGLLPWQTILAYEKCDPANAKLRSLLDQKIGSGAWQLLWVPPSLPYYRPATGPYAKPQLQDFTKALIFSSWVVVPKVIAMLCSYEAERQMVKGFDASAGYTTEDRRRRRPLLVYAYSQQRLTGMPTFCLFYPCLTLAKMINPLLLASELPEAGGVPEENAVLQKVEDCLRRLLQPILPRDQVSEGPPDERWYWVSLALLDRKYSSEVRPWLETDDPRLSWEAMIQGADDSDSRFAEHVRELMRVMKGTSPSTGRLGRPPEDLVSVLARVALASPAVVALRSLTRVCRHPESLPSTDAILAGAARIAMGFRTLFNIPESICMIRSLRARDDASYWRSVLDYCVSGNLQAVVDEYLHVLREAMGLVDAHPDDAAYEISREVESSLSLRTASLSLDEIIPKEQSVELVEHKMRCRFALQFTDVRSDDGKVETRRDQVRAAFNSPFPPFVLATTSIGQEGLDFHQYCHEIYHWNLPANPIDLEQREGRIHRYKGHVIRRNVAVEFPLGALKGSELTSTTDPWAIVFAMAKLARPGHNDLVPYWVFEPVGQGHKVLRHVPALPLSRDLEHIQNLRRTVVAYRMVLGQPRQEDLVNYLSGRLGRDVTAVDLLRYRIDLSPGV